MLKTSLFCSAKNGECIKHFALFVRFVALKEISIRLIASHSMAAEAPPQPVRDTSGTKVIVNKRQDGNPVLKYVRATPYEWSRDIKSDFECGRTLGLLYLTLKWHKLHPGYLETRLNDLNIYEIKVHFLLIIFVIFFLCNLQILLVLSNVDEPSFMLRDLNMLCYRSKWMMIVCYSVEEAGEYIENLKLSETRSYQATINAMQAYKQKQQRLREPTERDKNREACFTFCLFVDFLKIQFCRCSMKP